MKKKGFTLIELLAVIVILGVIMIIAIPSVTGYITNSRKDSYVSDAKMFLEAAKARMVADENLPHRTGEKVIIPISDISFDKGGEKSPFGNDWNLENSYIIVQNIGTSSDPKYLWEIALEDEKGNCIPLTTENDLKREVVGTDCDIYPNGINMDLNVSGVIPEGAVYYSGVTDINLDTLTVTAAYTYLPGENFPTLQTGDVYLYGDYGYAYNIDGNLLPDDTMKGWHSLTLDKTKTTYGPLLESISGEVLVSIEDTFYNCANMITVPVIPKTVINIDRAFGNCVSLTGEVEINHNVIIYRDAFSGTLKPIEITGTIPTELKTKIANTATMGNVTIGD